MNVRVLRGLIQLELNTPTATSPSICDQTVTHQALIGTQNIETPNNKKLVLIEEIIFISKIKHLENLILWKKIKYWELGKISYMRKVQIKHNG